MQVRLDDKNTVNVLKLHRYYAATVPGYSLSICQLVNYIIAATAEELVKDTEE